MKKMYFMVMCLFFMIMGVHAQQIAINEIMASNSTVKADEDGDFEDWIEIYNFGSQTINLENYGLSDNAKNPFKWVFPAVTIEPGSFLLIWASGKDRTNPSLPLHTNFSISSSGEEILISHPDSRIIDQSDAVPIPTNVSYGRNVDGTGNWVYFEQPTPVATNNTPGASGVLSPPVFSSTSGFYQSNFNLNITHTEPGVTILYTLDGSIPHSDNISVVQYHYKNSHAEHPDSPITDKLVQTFQTKTYTGAIPIYDRTPEDNRLSVMSSTWHYSPPYFPSEPVDKAIVVRARAVKEGMISSDVVTQTYFVNSTGTNNFTFPTISLIIQEDFFFDYDKGIYVAGVDFETWRINNPTTPRNEGRPANYQRSGREWEYPATLEYFLPNGTSSVLTQDIGVRIHGSWMRARPMKSLRLYARDSYGDSHLQYKFFSSIPHNQFKRLILRNSGNDSNRTYLRDAVIQNILGGLNFDTQASQPSVVFVNGEYWGIHNIRERYDRHYIGRTHDVDEDNIDLLTNNAEVKEGDANHYNALIQFVEQNNMASQQNYDYIKTQMDVYNFMDYYLAQIFINNKDWPGNNIDFWRYRAQETYPDRYFPADGRWRWMLFDTDWGFARYDTETAHTENNMLHATQLGTYAWSTLLFRKLLENETFKQDFINRFADVMNTWLTSERIEEKLNYFRDLYAPEIPRHQARWTDLGTLTRWHRRIDEMIHFGNERPSYQRQHLREFFNLGDDVTITLDVDEPRKGYIRINTVDIKSSTPGVSTQPYPWNGMYFQNMPIAIEAVANEGFVFSHWEGASNSTQSSITLTPTQSTTSLKAHFKESDEREFIHYWHFNRLDGVTESIPSDFSVTGTATITYPGTDDGYMDERTHRSDDPVSNLNLFLSQKPDQGAVLRVRNPAASRELIIKASTKGYQELEVAYATTRTSNGAQNQEFYYSSNGGSDWTKVGDTYSVRELDITQNNSGWDIISFDLSNVAALNDNDNVQFKILFTGPGADFHSGNNRFDNVSIRGNPILGSQPYQLKIMPVNYGNPILVDNDFFLWVHLVDQNGVRANNTQDIEISLSLGSGNGNLSGTTSIQVASGKNAVLYNDLKYDTVETGISIIATGAGLQNDTSDFFDVVSNPLNTDGEIDNPTRISPNPANSHVFINSQEEFHSVELIDLTGKIVHRITDLNTTEYVMDTSIFNNGFYFLRVLKNSSQTTYKLQILK